MLEFPRELNVMKQRSFLALLSKEARSGFLELNKLIDKLREKFEGQAKKIENGFYRDVFEKHMSTAGAVNRDKEKERFIAICRKQVLDIYKPLVKIVENKCDELKKVDSVSSDVKSILETASIKARDTAYMILNRVQIQIERF